MANDVFFTATKDWQAVENELGVIGGGTFSVINRDGNWVWITKSDTMPDASENGVFDLHEQGKFRKDLLQGSETFYVKTLGGDALLGVISVPTPNS